MTSRPSRSSQMASNRAGLSTGVEVGGRAKTGMVAAGPFNLVPSGGASSPAVGTVRAAPPGKPGYAAIEPCAPWQARTSRGVVRPSQSMLHPGARNRLAADVATCRQPPGVRPAIGVC